MKELKFLWTSDPDCPDNNCPSLYETEGGYVVQGFKLDDATREQLRNISADEDAIFVPQVLLDRLKEA